MAGEEIRGAGDLETEEVRRAAELIVGRVASDEALWRRLNPTNTRNLVGFRVVCLSPRP